MIEIGVRVSVDDSDATIGKKIRMHRKMRPAYMLILGEDEQKEKTVSIRIDRKGEPRSGEQCNGVPLSEFLENLSKEISSKSKDLSLVK